MNSRWSFPIFDRTVNPIFSGRITWERLSWGPEPWNVEIKQPALFDQQGFEVARLDRMVVHDFDFWGLLEDRYQVGFVGLYDGHVSLIERPHTYDDHVVIWNIVELFKPADSLLRLDDGEPLPPILVQINNCDLNGINALVKMGVVDVLVRDASASDGFFSFDVPTKKMRIRAEYLTTKKINTQVYLRDKTPEMTKREAIEAPISKTLEYDVSQLRGEALWWLGDSFGGGDLSATLYRDDHVQLWRWVMELRPVGVPHGRAQFVARIREVDRYISPWSLDRFVRGEVQARGDLNGPLDNPASRGVNVEGQLFLPQVKSARFQFDLEKRRDGLIQVSAGRLWSLLGDLGFDAHIDLRKRLGIVEMIAHELIWSSLKRLPQAWKIWEKSAQGEITVKLRPGWGEQSDTPSSSSLNQWNVEVKTDLVAQGPKRVKLTGRASLLGSQLTLHQSQITLRHPADLPSTKPLQKLSMKGKLNLTNQRFDGSAHFKGQITPSSIPPLTLPLSGHIDLSLQGQGDLKHPKIRGRLKAHRLKSDWGKYPWRIQSIQSEFLFDETQLKLQNSSIITQRGEASFELTLPWRAPQQTLGWAKLDNLYVDLQSLEIPFQGSIDGIACTIGPQGCTLLTKMYPSASGDRDSCEHALYQRAEKKKKSIEACLSVKDFEIDHVEFSELELNASLTPNLLKVRRGRLWKSPILLVDLQGQVEGLTQADPKITASLKLLNLPLQLAKQFVKAPPHSLDTLYGTATGELEVSGSLHRPEGKGQLQLKGLSTRISPEQRVPLQLGESAFDFELNPNSIFISGRAGRQIWIDGELRLNPLSLDVGFSFPQLNLSYMRVTSQLADDETTPSSLLKPRVAPEFIAKDLFGPFMLSSDGITHQLVALGLDQACAWTQTKNPLTQLLHLNLQGRGNLSWRSGISETQISIDLDQLNANYWLKDRQGDTRRSNNQASCALRCPSQRAARDEGVTKKTLHCPTLSFAATQATHVELRFNETEQQILINPTRTWGQLSSSVPSERKCSSVHLQSRRMGETLELSPLQVEVNEGAAYPLSLTLGLSRDQVMGCLSGGLDLELLDPLLHEYYQSAHGLMSLQLNFDGPMTRPRVRGDLILTSLELLSPRLRMLGDLNLSTPTRLILSPLREGGLSLTLPDDHLIALTRNESDIILDVLQVNLPDFQFGELSFALSAPQFDISLPPFIRASLNLKSLSVNLALPVIPEDSEPFQLDPKLEIKGEIDIIRAIYTADFLSLDKTLLQGGLNLVSGRTAVDTLSIFETVPLLKALDLDLRLKGDNEIQVKSQIADLATLDLELFIDMLMKGKLFLSERDPIESRLQMNGEISAIEGSTITISKNPFDVTYGKVKLGGGINTETRVGDFLFAELIATHTFRIPSTVGTTGRQLNFDQTLNNDLVDEEITLTGQVKMATQDSPFQVDFDFTSQSGRDRIEVINLVLFGSYQTGVGAVDGSQPTTGLLLSPVLNFIERPLADSLGLDSLSLTPDSSGLFIDINKVFSRRLRFNLRTQIGDVDPTDTQSLFLEYKLNNAFSGEIAAERKSEVDTVSGRLRLRLSWD